MEVFLGVKFLATEHSTGKVHNGRIKQGIKIKRKGWANIELNIYNPYICEVDVEEPCQKKVSLETLLKETDFVSVHLKVNPDTRGFIGEKEFNLIKKQNIL